MIKRLSNIFRLKCPRCQQGDLFETHSFSFQKPFDMPKECARCRQSYWPEPGFYYGAMFISYIFMGWFCLGFVALFHWVFMFSINTSFLILIALCAFGFVYVFRLARSIWIHLTVKYDPDVLKPTAK
jgi:uncharacterized protein (DUF983 family)